MKSLVIASLLAVTAWNLESTLGAETKRIKPCDECKGEVICEGSCECVVTDDDGVTTSYPCAPEKDNPQACTTIPVEKKPAPKPCYKCPKSCSWKNTISSLPKYKYYYWELLPAGVYLKDGWEVKYVLKKGCYILTIRRKGNKEFCIHDLKLRIGGKNCYKFKLSIKGKDKVTSWCLGPDGDVIIPPNSPLYNGKKTKKLVIKLCPSSCNVISWILCACIEPPQVITSVPKEAERA